MLNIDKNTIKKVSDEILTLCENPHTALQAIHKIIQVGGAGELTWQVVFNRTIADKDVKAAVYLVSFAQKIDDLPFDVLSLIDLVMNSDDESSKSLLLSKLPAESRVEVIKSHAGENIKN